MTRYNGIIFEGYYWALYDGKFVKLSPDYILGYTDEDEAIFDLAIEEEEMRPVIRYIKNDSKEYKKDLIGVEVGVQYGTNSLSILNELPMKKLYMVDTDYHISTRTRILSNDEFKGKMAFIHGNSHDALESIPDNLDFVYLDGSGHKDVYTHDILEYYKKVRIGGVVGGQLGWGNNPGSVNRHNALIDVRKELDCEVNLKLNGFPTLVKGGIDWWLVKEDEK